MGAPREHPRVRLRARGGGRRRRSRALRGAMAHPHEGLDRRRHEGDADAARKARELGVLLLAREGVAVTPPSRRRRPRRRPAQAVRTSGAPSRTTIVCSACAPASRRPCAPSSRRGSSAPRGPPAATSGSIVMTSPSRSGCESAGVEDVGHVGRLMDAPADAVPHQPVADREAARVHDALHGRADLVERRRRRGRPSARRASACSEARTSLQRLRACRRRRRRCGRRRRRSRRARR